MPLPHSHKFEGFGYGGSSEQNLYGQCQKRKIEFTNKMESEEIFESCELRHESIPKRQCQWLSLECKTMDFPPNGIHCGDVNMEEDRDVRDRDVQDREPYISNNSYNNQTSITCCKVDSDDTEEASASMNAQPVLTESHSVARGIPSSMSTPRKITQEKVGRCGYLSCRGLKPSPVSGRLYCHCSASWRGMYGLDIGYITDYY